MTIFTNVPIALGNRRVLQPGRLRWLRAAGWMVVMTLLILLSFRGGMAAIHALLPKGDPALGFVASAAGGLVAVAIYALLVRFGEDRRAQELALKPAIGQLVLGSAIGAAMFAAVMAALVILDLYRIEWHGTAPAWRAGGLAIQAALIEEVIVRGVILRLLWRAFGPVAAFAVSAALFGLGHIFNPGATIASAVSIALEAGIMLGAFSALTGRLWVSIGVHAAWNFVQGYVFGAAVSGGDMGPALARSTALAGTDAWLSGGAFGPEASLPALVICTAVGLVTLWLAWRGGRFASDALRDGAVGSVVVRAEPIQRSFGWGLVTPSRA